MHSYCFPMWNNLDFSFVSEVRGSQTLTFPLVGENNGGVRKWEGCKRVKQCKMWQSSQNKYWVDISQVFPHFGNNDMVTGTFWVKFIFILQGFILSLESAYLPNTQFKYHLELFSFSGFSCRCPSPHENAPCVEEKHQLMHCKLIVKAASGYLCTILGVGSGFILVLWVLVFFFPALHKASYTR